MENSIILEEILEELTENAKHISSSSLEKFANEIIKARHIFCSRSWTFWICSKRVCKSPDASGAGSILCGRTDNTGN